MKEAIRALLIEDNEEDRIAFQRNVSKLNDESKALSVEFELAPSLEDAICLLEKEKMDVILLDLSLPDSSELEGLRKIVDHFGDKTPVIVLTGQECETIALKAIKSGAQDYLQKKDITPFGLGRSIMYALERSRTSKELEELRVQQAKTLKMATLGEMAGGIAHEINNPLTIILGYADRLKRADRKNFEIEQYMEFGNKITFVTNRIAKIVKSLKAYSRKEDDDPMESAKLIHIVEDTLSLCSEKFKTASIELIIGEVIDVELVCKDVQLSQVLLNLLNNAHDAIQNNNEKWVRLYSQLDGNNLNLYVVDSGEVIDKETKRKIFQPFFTTKAKGAGTGLGMSISKNIIESHGGIIELLESSKNTTFKISLPIKNESKKTA